MAKPRHCRRVLVCGGREFSDAALLNRVLGDLMKTAVIDCLMEGNARGADRMAGYWARRHDIPNLKFDAAGRLLDGREHSEFPA